MNQTEDLTQEELDAANELNARFRKMMGQFVVEPDYMSFVDDRLPQWRFAYTKVKQNDGKYASWVERPVGPGSRTGNAKSLKRERIVQHKRKKDAIARAERLLESKLKGRGS